MPRIPLACCLLALCFVSTCAYAQRTYPKSLLWRISGKGLQQPSYLYGTMHDGDERLFHFGDSVYQALENTRGFAMEVNPDEMIAYYINKLLDAVEGSKPIHEVLSKQDFNKYRNALARKFGKPATEVTTFDVVGEKYKWVGELLESGARNTVMDSYLYYTARRQGKWVGGVEDLVDQTGMAEGLIDESDLDFLLQDDSTQSRSADTTRIEKLKQLYLNQDLAGIEALFEPEPVVLKDLLLVNRNKKMARRIDSLANLRSMFIAIGVAHLPGDNGVIQLLQKKGFTVEPVFSSRKVNSKNYVYENVYLPWSETTDPKGLYKISMPGNPVNVKVHGIVDMKFQFDIFSLHCYGSLAVINQFAGGSNKEATINTMAQNIFQTNEKLIPKKIINNGIEGREFSHGANDTYMRAQIYLHENIIYLAFTVTGTRESLTAEDATEYFKSFAIIKPVAKQQSYAFTDSLTGIHFMAPTPLTYSEKLSSTAQSSWNVKGYSGADYNNSSYILFFSKEVPPGQFTLNDTPAHVYLIQHLKPQYLTLKHKEFNIQGYKGISMQGRLKEDPSYYMQGVSLTNYNRNIVLMVMADSAHLKKPETQKIFRSLQVTPPAALPWQEHTTADSLLSAYVPAPFSIYDKEDQNFIYSFDPITACSYFIVTDTLSKYTGYWSDSLFWNDMILKYGGSADDGLIKTTTIQHHGQPVKELLTKAGNAYKRIRLVPFDDKIYQVMVAGDMDFVYHANATAFLNSFRINVTQQHPGFISQPKTALLLHDLASTDSATRNDAFDFLITAQFEKQDVPLLQQALFEQYLPLNSEVEADNINIRLALLLGELDDTSTVTYISKTYPSLTGEKEFLRRTALTALAHRFTKESYTAQAQLIDEYGAPDTYLDHQNVLAWKANPALTVSIFPTLQKLLSNKNHCASIAKLALVLRDSGYIKQEQLNTVQNDYINAARKLWPAVKIGDIDFYVTNELLQLIGSFNSTEGNDVLKTWLNAKSPFIREDAAVQLLKNKQRVPAPVMLELAANTQTRTSLYYELKALKRTALFPRQYATQQAFGESAIYELASEDYTVRTISFLAKRTASYKGQPYTFYLYRIVLEDDAEAGYLAVAGGYKPGNASLEPAQYLNGVNWSATCTFSTMNSLFKEFIKSLE